MPIEESDVRNIIAEVLIEATSWRLRECLRVRELAATHRRGQMRRLRMLEEQKVWKREADFDRIDTAAEMGAHRFHTSLVSELFYSKLCNPICPHTPDEYALEIRADVERLEMEISVPTTAYLSLGKSLHFCGPTLPVIAVAASEVGPAVLLFVEEVCEVVRFQTNSVPRYQ